MPTKAAASPAPRCNTCPLLAARPRAHRLHPGLNGNEPASWARADARKRPTFRKPWGKTVLWGCAVSCGRTCPTGATSGCCPHQTAPTRSEPAQPRLKQRLHPRCTVVRSVLQNLQRHRRDELRRSSHRSRHQPDSCARHTCAQRVGGDTRCAAVDSPGSMQTSYAAQMTYIRSRQALTPQPGVHYS